MSPAAVPLRSQIAPEHTWNAPSIFPSEEAWEAAFQEVQAQLSDLQRFRGHLGYSPATLVDWFEAVQRVFHLRGQVVVYTSLGHAVDTTDQDSAARNARAQGLFAQAMAATAFGDPEIIAIGFDTLRRWLREEPRLAIYAHYIDRLERHQAHVRSAEVEELLGQVLDPFRAAEATHGILANAELAFTPAHGSDDPTPIEIAQGNLPSLLGHGDREVRRTAWEHYADAHLAYKNTMANCLAAGVKQNVFIARARRFTSALEASVESNFIPVEVFHNLLATYRRNLPTWHRYWGIRRRALGYEKLRAYDRAAPLTAREPVVPFGQTVE